MPEFVLQPAPVSTKRRRYRSMKSCNALSFMREDLVLRAIIANG
jgi:hypothetical protein